MSQPTITLTVKTVGRNNNLTIANRIKAYAYASGLTLEVRESQEAKSSDFAFTLNYKELVLTKKQYILYGSIVSRLKQLQEISLALEEQTKELKKPEDGDLNIKASKKTVYKQKAPATAFFVPVRTMYFENFYPNIVLKGKKDPDLMPDWDRNKREPVALKQIIEKMQHKTLKRNPDDEWDEAVAVHAIYMLFCATMQHPLNRFPTTDNFSLTRFNSNFEQLYKYVREKYIVSADGQSGYEGVDKAIDDFIEHRKHRK